MDELRFERETAAEVIRELSQEPELFELFPAMSESPIRAFIERVRECDLFVLILCRQYSAPTMAEYKEAVACDKPIIVMVRSSNEPRDEQVRELLRQLEGRAAAPAQERAEVLPAVQMVYRTYGTLDEFRTELKRSLVYEIGKVLRPPLHTLTREEMYNLGTEIVEFSQRRLAIVERTPSLFFGVRPYHLPETQKRTYELRFAQSLERWIRSAIEDSRRSFIYAYSPDDVRRTLENQDESLRQALTARCAQNVRVYKVIEQDSGQRLRFGPLRTPFSGPLAVGDARFAFWLLGSSDAVAIHQENRSIADVVFRMLNRYTVRDVDAEAILGEFDSYNTR